MDIDYSSPCEMIFSMDSYITEAIDHFPEEIMHKIKTPAVKHLFKVNSACTKLCERDNIMFHQLVANLLFLSKRAQSDIQPTTAFLATRVRNPVEDEWKKLRRVLSYLDATTNIIKLHLNANNLKVFHWWVDAA